MEMEKPSKVIRKNAIPKKQNPSWYHIEDTVSLLFNVLRNIRSGTIVMNKSTTDCSIKRILASNLGITPRTIQNYLRSVYQEKRLKSIAERAASTNKNCLCEYYTDDVQLKPFETETLNLVFESVSSHSNELKHDRFMKSLGRGNREGIQSNRFPSPKTDVNTKVSNTMMGAIPSTSTDSIIMNNNNNNNNIGQDVMLQTMNFNENIVTTMTDDVNVVNAMDQCLTAPLATMNSIVKIDEYGEDFIQYNNQHMHLSPPSQSNMTVISTSTPQAPSITSGGMMTQILSYSDSMDQNLTDALSFVCNNDSTINFNISSIASTDNEQSLLHDSSQFISNEFVTDKNNLMFISAPSTAFNETMDMFEDPNSIIIDTNSNVNNVNNNHTMIDTMNNDNIIINNCDNYNNNNNNINNNYNNNNNNSSNNNNNNTDHNNDIMNHENIMNNNGFGIIGNSNENSGCYMTGDAFVEGIGEGVGGNNIGGDGVDAGGEVGGRRFSISSSISSNSSSTSTTLNDGDSIICLRQSAQLEAKQSLNRKKIENTLKYYKYIGELMGEDLMKKVKRRNATVTSIEEFDRCLLRRKIHYLLRHPDANPSMTTLRELAENEIQFTGSKSSFFRIVTELGFEHKRIGTKPVLTENELIRLDRLDYIRSIKSYRNDGWPIVYIGKFFLDYRNRKLDSISRDELVTVSKSVHIVCGYECFSYETGRVDTPVKLFELPNFQYENYEREIEKEILSRLPTKTVIVIDNLSPFNRILADTVPKQSANIQKMRQWFDDRNITYSLDSSKENLYHDILEHKLRLPREYKIDRLIKRYNHVVLRRPPAHPELCPIDCYWACVSIAQFKFKLDVNISRELSLERLEQLDVFDWAFVCDNILMNEDFLIDQEDCFVARMDKEAEMQQQRANLNNSKAQEDDDDEDDVDDDDDDGDDDDAANDYQLNSDVVEQFIINKSTTLHQQESQQQSNHQPELNLMQEFYKKQEEQQHHQQHQQQSNHQQQQPGELNELLGTHQDLQLEQDLFSSQQLKEVYVTPQELQSQLEQMPLLHELRSSTDLYSYNGFQTQPPQTFDHQRNTSMCLNNTNNTQVGVSSSVVTTTAAAAAPASVIATNPQSRTIHDIEQPVQIQYEDHYDGHRMGSLTKVESINDTSPTPTITHRDYIDNGCGITMLQHSSNVTSHQQQQHQHQFQQQQHQHQQHLQHQQHSVNNITVLQSHLREQFDTLEQVNMEDTITIKHL